MGSWTEELWAFLLHLLKIDVTSGLPQEPPGQHSFGDIVSSSPCSASQDLTMGLMAPAVLFYTWIRGSPSWKNLQELYLLLPMACVCHFCTPAQPLGKPSSCHSRLSSWGQNFGPIAQGDHVTQLLPLRRQGVSSLGLNPSTVLKIVRNPAQAHCTPGPSYLQPFNKIFMSQPLLWALWRQSEACMRDKTS